MNSQNPHIESQTDKSRWMVAKLLSAAATRSLEKTKAQVSLSWSGSMAEVNILEFYLGQRLTFHRIHLWRSRHRRLLPPYHQRRFQAFDCQRGLPVSTEPTPPGPH
jgi:hypothetical protein